MRKTVGVLMLGVILFTGCAILTFLLAFGVPLFFGAFLAGLGLVIPLLVGYLAPDPPHRTRRLFITVALVPLAVISGLLILLSGPVRAWQLGSGSMLLALIYTAVSVPVILTGAGLRRQADRHPWLRWGLRSVAIVVMAGTLAFGLYLRGLGLLPFAYGSRLEAYERLWANLEHFYVYWASSPVTPQELKARYRPRIEAADLACRGKLGTCRAYQDELRNMLAELQDGHTHLQPKGVLVTPPVTVEPIEGQAVITWVEPGSEAEAAGLVPGMIITTVNELSVEPALNRVPAWAVAYAAPHTRRYYAYYNLLAGLPNETVHVGVESYDGKRQTVVLHRKGRSTDASPAVRGQRRADGLAYITVAGLAGQDTVAIFDQLLDGMFDAPGLILDLRGNGGGNSALGDQMVSRLITQMVIYGRECYRASHPMHSGTTGCTSIDVGSRGRPYLRRVAVLIDNQVHSSGEWMAAALCDTGRARCFGRTTAGDSGNPVFFFMPDVTVQFSTGIFSRNNGVLLNGVGIAPHVEIEWTLEDVRQGRDPDLEAARA